MSLFGSREDDPLLQDDPFAPQDEGASDSGRDTAEDPGADEPPPASAEAGPPAEAASKNDEPDESSPTDADEPFSFTGSEARRALVRRVDEAEAGSLSELNAAFDEGWRLDRVAYRSETADLLFVLRRRDAGAGQGGLIV